MSQYEVLEVLYWVLMIASLGLFAFAVLFED